MSVRQSAACVEAWNLPTLEQHRPIGPRLEDSMTFQWALCASPPASPATAAPHVPPLLKETPGDRRRKRPSPLQRASAACLQARAASRRANVGVEMVENPPWPHGSRSLLRRRAFFSHRVPADATIAQTLPERQPAIVYTDRRIPSVPWSTWRSGPSCREVAGSRGVERRIPGKAGLSVLPGRPNNPQAR